MILLFKNVRGGGGGGGGGGLDLGSHPHPWIFKNYDVIVLVAVIS